MRAHFAVHLFERVADKLEQRKCILSSPINISPFLKSLYDCRGRYNSVNVFFLLHKAQILFTSYIFLKALTTANLL